MSPKPLAPGAILAGKYQLAEPLGVGGMGTVYRAEHLILRAPVAVKVIEGEQTEGDLGLTRFMREAQVAAALRSPHVVQILDYGVEEERAFMVMELLEGETLAQRLERERVLSPFETARVLLHVSRAVGRAHEAGIVHRDLKPDNVFLVHNEGDEIAKVLDFGVAKMEATAWSGGTHTRTGSLLGTPYYMSPEQAQGNKEVDFRSDLWALGVIAFECLVGRRPFESDGLGELVLQICIRDIPVPSSWAEVPSGFDAWFAKATHRELGSRFQSAKELADALIEALGVKAELNLGGEAQGSALAAQRSSILARKELPSEPLVGRVVPPPANQAVQATSGAEGSSAGPWSEQVAWNGDEESTSRASRWEVMPKMERAEPSSPVAAAPQVPPGAAELAHGRAGGAERTGVSFWLIFLISVLAVGVGALTVLLFLPENWVSSRVSTQVFHLPAPASSSGKSPGKAGSPAKGAKTGKVEAPEGSGSARSSSPAASASALAGGLSREGAALDRLEQGVKTKASPASSALPDNRSAAPATSSATGSTTAGGSSGPSPVVPDSLRPTPPPPPAENP